MRLVWLGIFLGDFLRNVSSIQAVGYNIYVHIYGIRRFFRQQIFRHRIFRNRFFDTKISRSVDIYIYILNINTCNELYQDYAQTKYADLYL